tara:strand:+ start:9471 stop:10061 length:591 start_codon:yes stop_codon:yes gene_type:complete
MEDIKKVLECNMCGDIATLPVKGICCDNTKSLPPGCLLCVREYYELNKKPHERSTNQKMSWSGCGCSINLRNSRCDFYYKHCYELDQIRNILGKSNCYHVECNKEFETCAELRRHLNGTALENDKHGNCPEAFTKCKYCNIFDKRKIIEGEHYKQFHAFIVCNVCKLSISFSDAKNHYNIHNSEIKEFKKKIKEYI